ncbi:type II toxin-antitoxin system RelB/DinJ family antitoxin [Candidatus Kaiserbacteria bacterium]|nr:type II toxin-antitoxin system RelB/DinJ family antitoxin [Candidatus Kaiserbacteria bacterium]
MTTLNVRIEEKTKKAAKKALEGVGLDLSSGVKLFLNQVVTEQGLPFMPTKNPAALRAKWDREVADAIKNGKKYTSTKELFKDLGIFSTAHSGN